MYMEYEIWNVYGIFNTKCRGNLKCIWNMPYEMYTEYLIWNVHGIWKMQSSKFSAIVDSVSFSSKFYRKLTFDYICIHMYRYMYMYVYMDIHI